jgi:hypothetical protein
MSKVTRIAYSKHLNQGKYERLTEIARRLGKLRAEVWQGSDAPAVWLGEGDDGGGARSSISA